MKHFAFAFLLLCAAIAYSFAQQDPALVYKAVENWLKVQTKGLPGQVSFEIGALDAGNQLVSCNRFDVSQPPGARLWGRTHVLIRCLGEAGWRIYLPVQVRVRANYLVSARPIAQGQVIVADDLSSQFGDLAELPANILTDPALAIGKVARAAIPVGQPLRSDMFRGVTVVQQNQTVKVISRGPGFVVSNEGKALNSAVEGQVTQVRLGNGQVVSGIARNGAIVEITH